MHPYIRTMFLSLGIGTLGVLGSMIYYIHVAEATKPFLEARAVEQESAAAVEHESFAQMIEGPESQDGDGAVAVRPPPREYLKQKAEELGYSYALLNRIAYCESHWRMVKNRRSSAYGYFQIIDSTERMTPQYKMGLRKSDPYVNIDMALYLYGKQGTLPWLASRRCWSR